MSRTWKLSGPRPVTLDSWSEKASGQVPVVGHSLNVTGQSVMFPGTWNYRHRKLDLTGAALTVRDGSVEFGRLFLNRI